MWAPVCLFFFLFFFFPTVAMIPAMRPWDLERCKVHDDDIDDDDDKCVTAAQHVHQQ